MRTQVITIRVTPQELEVLKAHAAQAGYRSKRGPGVSGYLRDTGLQGHTVTDTKRETLEDIYTALNDERFEGTITTPVVWTKRLGDDIDGDIEVVAGSDGEKYVRKIRIASRLKRDTRATRRTVAHQMIRASLVMEHGEVDEGVALRTLDTWMGSDTPTHFSVRCANAAKPSHWCDASYGDQAVKAEGAVCAKCRRELEWTAHYEVTA